jgi:NAD+ synthase
MKGLILSNDTLDDYKDRIVDGIRTFVDESGARGAVVGLSGGIDSALVAALGKLALGDRLQALIMPETGLSREEDVEHAVMFAKDVGIHYRIIELKEVLESIRQVYPDLLNSKRGFLARANLAPRLRMLFNYAVSNFRDLVVLGTGNKTELMLGYFTKYGDGGVDFLPIGDLYKTQVRQLASHIGTPDYIVDKPPSAGLWYGQTDEDELGETYENIDRVLFLMFDRGFSVEKTASTLKIEREKVDRIIGLVDKNLHKRRGPEVIELS